MESATTVEADTTEAATARNEARASRLREAARNRTLEGWFPTAPVHVGSRRVGLVGAGVMGAGIARWCALRGHSVVLHDVSADRVAAALAGIQAAGAAAVRAGRMQADQVEAAARRLTAAANLSALAGCDLIIEAIVEDVATKQALFGELASIVGPGTILASNTSALPMEDIFRDVPHPGRTIGLHFFNPVDRMALVEIVIGAATTGPTAAAVLGFARSLDKSPVICRSSPGFVVTRVLFFYLNEACRLWEEGVPLDCIDRALRDWGWPMGPMRLIDEAGVDVTDFIFGELAAYFPGRFAPTTACRRLLERGDRGRKGGEGAGFYAHRDRTATSRETAIRPLAPARGGPVPSDESIRQRLMQVMNAEADLCVRDKVVLSPDDIDFALLAGAGFPAFRGGLLAPAATLP